MPHRDSQFPPRAVTVWRSGALRAVDEVFIAAGESRRRRDDNAERREQKAERERDDLLPRYASGRSAASIDDRAGTEGLPQPRSGDVQGAPPAGARTTATGDVIADLRESLARKAHDAAPGSGPPALGDTISELRKAMAERAKVAREAAASTRDQAPKRRRSPVARLIRLVILIWIIGFVIAQMHEAGFDFEHLLDEIVNGLRGVFEGGSTGPEASNSIRQ